MADYKHWILMGSLMGMALTSTPVNAYDDQRRNFRGETREDELDDRSLYNSNQRQVQGQQCNGPQCAQPAQGGGNCPSGQCGQPQEKPLACGGCGVCEECRKRGPGPAALVDDGI